jgi:hypothetical protein
MSRLPFNSVGGYAIGATGANTVIDASGNFSGLGATFTGAVDIYLADGFSNTTFSLGKVGLGDSLEFYGGGEGDGWVINAWTLDKSGYTNLTTRANTFNYDTNSTSGILNLGDGGNSIKKLTTFSDGVVVNGSVMSSNRSLDLINPYNTTHMYFYGGGETSNNWIIDTFNANTNTVTDIQLNFGQLTLSGSYVRMPNGQTASSVVSLLNGLSGAVTITAGSNITIGVTGNRITISSSGSGSGTTGATGPTGPAGSQGATGATGPQGATGPVNIASYTATGAASFSSNDFVVTAAGAVSLTSGIVRSFNGLTGTVTYAPPLATTSVTGVASFNSSDFTVTTGAVSLSNVARTNSTNTFSNLQTFSAGITAQSIFVSQGATFAGRISANAGITSQNLYVSQGATFGSSLYVSGNTTLGGTTTNITTMPSGQVIKTYSLTTSATTQVNLATESMAVYSSADILIQAEKYDLTFPLGTLGTQNTRIQMVANPAGTLVNHTQYSNIYVGQTAASYDVDTNGVDSWRLRVTPNSTYTTIFRVYAILSPNLGGIGA